MSVLDRLIDRVGDSNPQLFRELKERLTLGNIGGTVAVALVIQVLLSPYFNNGRLAILEWLNWILSLGLILGSVYLLVADLVRERKRGTLNSIRLSPQSARQIFIGKILGVPILIYVAAAVMLPLHLLSGLSCGYSLPLIAGWYAMIGAMWFLLSSAAVLYVLIGGTKAILIVVVAAYPIYIALMIINDHTVATIFSRKAYLDSGVGSLNRYVTWFGLPFTDSTIYSAILFSTFVIGSCLVASYWVWQVLDRRYRNPTGTRIGKSQSYLINFCLQVWIAGLTIPTIGYATQFLEPNMITGLGVIDMVALTLLIWMLLPSKQASQDAHYRHERLIHQQRTLGPSYLAHDLVKNDPRIRSDAAIAINVLIMLALWLPLLVMEVGSIVGKHIS
jgi:MFS family permease